MRQSTKALLAIIGTTVAGSGIPVFSKLVLKEIGPTEMMAIRFLIATLIFLPLIYKTLPRKVSEWLEIAVVVFPAAINMMLFAYGIQFTTATMSSFIYALGPVAVAVVAYLIGQEKITLRKTVGILIGLAGMLTIIILPLKNSQLSSLIGTPLGNGLLLIGMLSWTIYTIASKPLNNKFPSLVITFMAMLVMFLTSFSFGGFRVFNPNSLKEISPTTWFFLGYLGIVCSVIFFFLYQLSIKLSSSVSASMMLYIQPVLNFILAAILLGEKLNPLLVIAGSLTLTGAYLTTTASNRKKL
jgi:drug/metabolite transporter (DMT)-like permease